MPSHKNSEPPEVMTWMRAAPILALSVVFDVLRSLCGMLWFFGPVLAAAWCADKVSAVVGETVGEFFCTAGAAAAGAAASPLLGAFGAVAAMAVGLFGWMTIGLLIVLTNARLIKEHTGHSLWFASSLLVSEIPLVGSLPALTFTIAKLYRTQIKKDAEALAAYEKERGVVSLQEERERRASLFTQARMMREQEEADEAERALNETNEEIPDEMREAA